MLHGGVAISIVASQQESSWVKSLLCIFPYACVGSLYYFGFLALSRNRHVRSIHDSRMILRVTVSVHVCLSRLSLCPGPAMDWQLSS